MATDEDSEEDQEEDPDEENFTTTGLTEDSEETTPTITEIKRIERANDR